ncbi:MAG TPA: ABC-2 family transporter protein [Gemmatimonadales bacterium]|nr:ABC-2 family transporter protein [Gemmatimonadales bacterium]
MSVWLRRYAALIRAAWLVDLQYRAAIAIWMVWNVTEPAIALGIWWSIAGPGAVQGFARADFARYFFGVALVNQLTLAWDAWYIDRWIREGEMNFRLARPVAPVHEAVADNIAYKARTASAVLLVWMLVALVWPAVRIEFAPGRWAVFLVAAGLAAAIRFLNGYATGLLAFWTTRATALMELQFGVSLFLSGRLAPLALLPPRIATLAGFLWFPYILAFPVEVLTGAVVTPAEYLRGFAGQAVWLVAWWAAYRAVWGRGIRHYGAVGG